MILNYNVLFEKNGYALIERGNDFKEYAVVSGLVAEENRRYEGSDWDSTVYYTWKSVNGLQKCLEVYRYVTEANYITRTRLEEIATRFKDFALENCEIGYLDEVVNEIELDKNELKFFGVDLIPWN